MSIFAARHAHNLLGAGVICASLLFTAQAGAQGEPAAAATPSFTAEQAERGGATYARSCAGCHGEDMVGIFGGYGNASIFFGFVSSEMPADAPGSLPAQAYADIIAYLLSENGFAPGDTELPADPAVLAEVKPSAGAAQ